MSDATQIIAPDGHPISSSDPLPIYNVGLTALAPVLIGTISYTGFTASGIYYQSYPGSLTRNVRERTFLIQNSLNEALTSVWIYFGDSTIQAGFYSSPNSEIDSTGITTGTPDAQLKSYTSEGIPILASHVDSFEIGLGMGVTAPTSGNVKIYLVELK